MCVCRCLKRAEALDLLRLGGGNKNLTSEEHSRKPCVWRPAVLKMDEAGDWQDSEELGE